MKSLCVSINTDKKQNDFAKISQFILEIEKGFDQYQSIRNTKNEKIVASIWWIHKNICLMKIFAGPAHFDSFLFLVCL